MTRRVFITLTGTTLATTSGCLGILGIGSESESRESADSGSDSDSDFGDDTTNGSNSSDDPPEPEPNSSENVPRVENETNESGSEENDAAVPESPTSHQYQRHDSSS